MLHRCVLAEEIGHHFTKAESNLLVDNQSIRKRVQILIDEYKARIWAVNFLVPYEEFKEVVQGSSLSDKELAKYFRVTKEFIKLRRSLDSKELEIYRC
ncbi:Zn-dependent peptidase ImmA (M78 family) [Desulfohalotomaculum tongense]|nr:Zn-dependent peptidase ImmA (M78 family) [Desulforadius tongensis]